MPTKIKVTIKKMEQQNTQQKKTDKSSKQEERDIDLSSDEKKKSKAEKDKEKKVQEFAKHAKGTRVITQMLTPKKGSSKNDDKMDLSEDNAPYKRKEGFLKEKPTDEQITNFKNSSPVPGYGFCYDCLSLASNHHCKFCHSKYVCEMCNTGRDLGHKGEYRCGKCWHGKNFVSMSDIISAKIEKEDKQSSKTTSVRSLEKKTGELFEIFPRLFCSLLKNNYQILL